MPLTWNYDEIVAGENVVVGSETKLGSEESLKPSVYSESEIKE